MVAIGVLGFVSDWIVRCIGRRLLAGARNMDDLSAMAAGAHDLPILDVQHVTKRFVFGAQRSTRCADAIAHDRARASSSA